jgi:acetyl esterase/lipase
MRASALRVFLTAVFCGVVSFYAGAEEVPPGFPLWIDGAPGATGTEPADVPSLTPYPAPAGAATGAAVVVVPGGGYGHLALDHEGAQIARWLNENGIAAFVLRYRIAPRYAHPAPVTDARRAVRTVRARAGEWGVDPDRIGMIGFSAGGHLTATAGTQFEDGNPDATDPVEGVSSRPDFLILMYAVITMTDPHTHAGSRRNLLGEKPDTALIEAMSAEKRVTRDSPPAFLMHTGDDPVVPVQNSVLFYQALVDAGVPVEMHLFEHGRHGVGLAQDDPALGRWPEMCIQWLKVRGII